MFGLNSLFTLSSEPSRCLDVSIFSNPGTWSCEKTKTTLTLDHSPDWLLLERSAWLFTSALTDALLMFKLHFIAIAPLRGKAGGPQKEFNISKTFVSKWFQCSESPDWLGLYKRCRVVSGVWMEVPEAPVGERKCNQCRIALRWRTLKCASVGRGTSCSLPTSAPLPPSLPSFRSVFLFSSQSLFSPCESVPLFLFSLRRVACFIYSP